MPFIDCRVTKKLSDDKKEALKRRFGENIGILHKPESFLMIGFNDGYDLYMAGKKLESGAYIGVELFGDAGSDAYEALTSKICQIMNEELDIPADKVYVKYHPVSDWGWNGRNF